MNELVIDQSHWQDKRTRERILKQIAAGVRGVYQKFTQGATYVDDTHESVLLYQEEDVATGPYHFVTTENADRQYQNFVTRMQNFAFLFPPALDCEGYSAVGGQDLSLNEIRKMVIAEPDPYDTYSGPNEPMSYYAAGNILLTYKGAKVRNYLRVADRARLLPLTVRILYGLTYPSEAVVDSIGRKLITWMESRSDFKGFTAPAIYTNYASGKKIFKSKVIGTRYGLWVAHWRVSKPLLPPVWEGQDYMLWQYDVVSGAPFGLTSQLDVNRWGSKVPFPGVIVPPPPPPPTGKARVRVETSDGKVFEGDVPEA